MGELENENDRLKRIIRDSHDPATKNAQTKIKADYMVLKQQIDQLKSQNKLLKEDVTSKQNIIQKIKFSNPNVGGAHDVEAIENLRRANERLMEQMVRLQEGLNNSMMSSVQKGGFNNSRSKADFLKQKGKWVKSEWVDKTELDTMNNGYGGSKHVHFGNGGLKSKFTAGDF